MKTFLSIIRNIPEPLKKFLKEKGAYRYYVKNCLMDEETTRETWRSRNNGYAFFWADTDEGHDFWDKIDDELRKRKII